jgi:hypothetical protein
MGDEAGKNAWGDRFIRHLRNTILVLLRLNISSRIRLGVYEIRSINRSEANVVFLDDTRVQTVKVHDQDELVV